MKSLGVDKKCLIVTAVWGEWHVNAFLEFNLRTMMANGNMPTFTSKVETKYIIYTTSQDIPRIKKNALFEKLEGIAHVHFIELSKQEIGFPIPTHQKIWRMGMEEAIRSNSFVMLMPPDVIWSDSSLGHLAELIESGKKAIFLNWHLRSNADTLVPQFLKNYSEDENPIAISSRDMVRLSIEHLLPICGASRRESKCFPNHPEMVFWPIKEEGVLMHVLALTPFVFHPKKVPLTSNKLVAQCMNPEDLHFVTDSDDLYMISLAKLGKDSDWYRYNAPLDYVEISYWWMYFDSPMNDLLAVQPYRLHYKECTSEKWMRRESEAKIFLRRLIWTRELYRIYLAAVQMGCNKAADIIAAAIHLGLAAHLCRKNVDVEVSIPTDQTLNQIWDDQIEPILQPHCRKSFVDLLRQHFVATTNRGNLRNTIKVSCYSAAQGGAQIANTQDCVSHSFMSRLCKYLTIGK